MRGVADIDDKRPPWFKVALLTSETDNHLYVDAVCLRALPGGWAVGGWGEKRGDNSRRSSEWGDSAIADAPQ